MAHGFLNGARYDEKVSSLVTFIERSFTELQIPVGVKTIGSGAFSYSALTNITIPEGVVSIGEDTFKDCNQLEEIKFPSTLESLGRQCIMNCFKLKKVVLPPKVSVIPVTFASSCRFTEFIAEGNIETIRGYALQYCSSCKKYDFTNCTSVPKLEQTTAFINIPTDCKILVPSHLYDSWIVATNWANYSDRIVPVYDAPEVTVPDQVSEGLAFTLCGNDWNRYYEVAGLGDCADEVLVIPSEYNGVPVTGLVIYCFSGNTSIKEVYIPESITGLGYAFENCTNLEKIYVDTSSITSFEFGCIPSLKYVKFGRLTFLGGGTFADCTDAVFDFSECTAVPEFDTYGYESGYESEFGTNPTIMVPVELYIQWIDDTNWAIYKDYIVPVK